MMREELEAALTELGNGYLEEWFPDAAPIVAAARRQLALMADTCEHGETKPHYPTGEHAPYKDFLDKAMHEYHPKTDPPTYSPPDQCSGRVYPQETVEKIAKVLFLHDHPGHDWESLDRLQNKWLARAVAVLDAMNLEVQGPKGNIRALGETE